MKSGFIELVVSRKMAGRAVASAPKDNRYRPIDSFKKYIYETLPKMEESIEIEMLKKNLLKIKSRPIRTQLINAYLRRLFRLRVYEPSDLKDYNQLNPLGAEPISAIANPTILKPINQHTQYDVGGYILFHEGSMEKVFKHGCFGRYTDEEYKFTNKFGVQVREQSLSIASLMKHIKNNAGKSIDWAALKAMDEWQKMNYINDENNYVGLASQLSRLLYAKVQQYRGHEEYYRVWGSSIISDTIINSILQSEEGLNDPINIMYQVIDAVMQLEPLPTLGDFGSRFKTLPGYPSIPTKLKLPENVQYFSTTPSLKSIFLGGQGGSGKSMILAYLSMFAHSNDWIVINVPNCYKWTHQKKVNNIRMYNGLYVINDQAVQWLDQFLHANKEKLEKYSINKDIFGKYDITGVFLDESDPVPNHYIEERRTYFNQIGDKFSERIGEKDREEAKKRITNVIENPSNLYELGMAGINNPQYATCAMGELLGQVYDLDVPILECVDAFSWLYRPSDYGSFRYFNYRGLFGKIPPYHIAHCRMFVNFDGHKLKNGLKVVTSSNYPLFKHKFDIKQMMYPPYYEHRVRNLNMEEFRKAGQWNINCKWWLADDIQRGDLDYSYVLTQGNWGSFQELMKFGHYC